MKKLFLLLSASLIFLLLIINHSTPAKAAACDNAGSYWVYLPMGGHFVCSSNHNNQCQTRLDGSHYCDSPPGDSCDYVGTSCGNLRADPSCDGGACDQGTCEADNFQPCVGTQSINGTRVCSWHDTWPTPTGTLNCGGGGGFNSTPLTCSSFTASHGDTQAVGVSSDGQPVPILSIAPGDAVEFDSNVYRGAGYMDRAVYTFGAGQGLCYENNAWPEQGSGGPPYLGVFFCNNGQPYSMPQEDSAWHTGTTPYPLTQQCSNCISRTMNENPDWSQKQALYYCARSTDQSCYVTADGVYGKPQQFASDGHTQKTYSTAGMYHAQVNASLRWGWEQNGGGHLPCRIDICVGNTGPGCGSPTVPPTGVPTISIRGRVENQGLTSPVQCTDNSAYYENGATVQLYRSNGTLLQSVTTYPGPAVTNPPNGYYNFTVTGQPQGQDYYVCGSNTSSRIFTHAIPDITTPTPVCAHYIFNGQVCILYQSISGPKNGRMIANAPTPTRTPTPTPTGAPTPTNTPVPLQPVLSCGAYDSTTGTFTVDGTWSPPNNVTFVMSTHSDYSQPFLNVTGTPPQSYVGAPANITLYGRVTSSGINYAATPIVCTPPNPTPYGVQLPMVTITGVSCTLTGWACDESNVGLPVHVNLYADNNLTPFAQPLAQFGTPPPGPPAPGNCLNTNLHGYSYPLPAQFQNNGNHTIDAKALGIKSGGTLDGTIVPLMNSPQTITCNIPPPPTPTIAPWVQLNAAAFQSSYSVSDKIPLSPAPYSGLGIGQPNFIISNGSPQQDAGAVTANGISLQSVNPSGAVSTKKWSNASYVAEGTDISDFIQYIKAKKTYHIVSDFSSLSPNNIYVIQNNNNVSIDGAAATAITNAAPIMLMFENSNVSINVAQFNPGNAAVVMLAVHGTGGGDQLQNPGRISFSDGSGLFPTTTSANGIFIADEVNTGTTVDQGLQITGNLITANLTNGRKWSNNNKPSLYIVNDVGQYVNVLNLLSKSTYEWTQLQ